MDIDEVEADNPRCEAKDHHRLSSEKMISKVFELIGWNGVELSKGVAAGVRPASVVGNSLDGYLLDGGLKERLANNPGVEVPGNR